MFLFYSTKFQLSSLSSTSSQEGFFPSNFDSVKSNLVETSSCVEDILDEQCFHDAIQIPNTNVSKERQAV